LPRDLLAKDHHSDSEVIKFVTSCGIKVGHMASLYKPQIRKYIPTISGDY